ncbi:MAG: SEC-C domain-containing protein [Armatimonadetes bacterium]|nr:SEC-C domain-containing protein [Armatimonadota bacterium]
MQSKISRNAPCPCGSGKKYKLCCMPQDESAAPTFQITGPRPVAYYRSSQEFCQVILRSDIGIQEAFFITERGLTDPETRRGVNSLIQTLRTSGYPPPGEDRPLNRADRSPTDPVLWSILRNWEILFEGPSPHSSDDLQGCLRSILESIKVWSTPAKDSQGYLYHLIGMMKSMKVTVDRLSLDGEPIEPEERPEDRLIELAEDWLAEGMPRYVTPFHSEAERLLDRHKASPVVHVCQYLIGRTHEQRTTDLLRPLLSRAYGQLGVGFG